MKSHDTILLLAGAGLANGLIALAVARRHPTARIVLFESAAAPGGNHTWSFHHDDLVGEARALVDPLVASHWPEQEVRFPDYSRRLGSGYASLTTETLLAALAAEPRIELRCGVGVVRVEAATIHLDDGTSVQGTAVIDGRGPRRPDGLVLGYQKFLGRELRTSRPHGIERPVIMDATVSQADGYRFVYLLPFESDRILIEDTYYSDGAELSDSELSARIDDYVAAQGWQDGTVLREERGILPILLAGDFDRYWPAEDPIARAGLRAALFHPTTGYSLPHAARLAVAIAQAWPLDGAALARLTRRHAREFWKRAGFFRLLNRMLFRCGQPENRYRVLQRFYSLDERIITRFYATSLRIHERLRILTGKPPLPIREALTVVDEAAFLRREPGFRVKPGEA
jgi:lycopene beta-cyclase